MNIIIILLFLSILVAGIFLVAFLWSVQSGQFQDEASPPMRMLLDDPELFEAPPEKSSKAFQHKPTDFLSGKN